MSPGNFYFSGVILAAFSSAWLPYAVAVFSLLSAAAVVFYHFRYLRAVRSTLLRVRGVMIAGRPDPETGAIEAKSLSVKWLAEDILDHVATTLGKMYTMADNSFIENRTGPYAEALVHSTSLELSRLLKTGREYEDALRKRLVEVEELRSDNEKLSEQYLSEKQHAEELAGEVEELNNTVRELDASTRRLDRELRSELPRRKRAEKDLETIGHKIHRQLTEAEQARSKMKEAMALMSPVVDRLAEQALEDLQEKKEAGHHSSAAFKPATEIERRFAGAAFPDAGSDPLASARRILEMNRIEMIRAAAKIESGSEEQAVDPSTEIIVMKNNGASHRRAEHDGRREQAGRGNDAYERLLRQNSVIRNDIVLSTRAMMEHIRSLERENEELADETEKIRENLNKWRQAVEERDEAIRNLESESGIRAHSYEMLERKLEDKDVFIAELNKQIAEQTEVIRKIREEVDTHRKEARTLREVFEEETVAAEQQRRERKAERQAFERLNAELKKQLEQREALIEQSGLLEKELELVRSSKAETVENEKRMTAVVETLRERIQQLEAERDKARRDRSRVEKLYQRYKEEMAETEQRYDVRVREVASIRAELEQLKHLRKQAAEQAVQIEAMPELQQKIQRLEEQVAAAEGRTASADKKNAQLEEALEKKEKEALEIRDEITSLRSEYEAVGEERDALRLRVKNLEVELESAGEQAEEADRLRGEIEAVREEAEGLRREIEESERERQSLAERDAEATGIEARYREQLDKLHDEKRVAERRCADLEETVGEKDAELIELRGKLSELETRAKMLEKELEHAREETALKETTLREEIERSRKAREDIAERIGRYEQQRREAEDTRRALGRKLESLEASLAARDEQIEEYRGRVAELTAAAEQPAADSRDTTGADSSVEEIEKLKIELQKTLAEAEQAEADLAEMRGRAESEAMDARRREEQLEAELNAARIKAERFKEMASAEGGWSGFVELSPDARGLPPDKLLKAEFRALADLENPRNSAIVYSLGIHTLADLEKHWLFLRARLLSTLSEIVEPSMTLAELGMLEELVIEDARNVPVSGLGELSLVRIADVFDERVDLEAFGGAGLHTVADVATWKPYREAAAVALLAR